MEAGAGIRSGSSAARPRPAHIAVVLTAAVLLGVVAAAVAHFVVGGRSSPAPPSALAARTVSSRFGLDGQATWAAGARPAPTINGLHDQSGALFSLAALRGRTIAMTFFDSHCTQECPLEGRALAAAERSLPTAERPVLVAISVNPAQDTPASDAAAAKTWGLGEVAPWHWLMGTPAELRRVWNEYHIYVGKSVGGDIPHTEALYLIDSHGDERSGYLYPFASRFVSHDLTVLAPRRTS
jgi:cytochrome oxidase Cu insertion factor (SCO1/SenC/PrrC family)